MMSSIAVRGLIKVALSQVKLLGLPLRLSVPVGWSRQRAGECGQSMPPKVSAGC